MHSHLWLFISRPKSPTQFPPSCLFEWTSIARRFGVVFRADFLDRG